MFVFSIWLTSTDSLDVTSPATPMTNCILQWHVQFSCLWPTLTQWKQVPWSLTSVFPSCVRHHLMHTLKIGGIILLSYLFSILYCSLHPLSRFSGWSESQLLLSQQLCWILLLLTPQISLSYNINMSYSRIQKLQNSANKHSSSVPEVAMKSRTLDCFRQGGFKNGPSVLWSTRHKTSPLA